MTAFSNRGGRGWGRGGHGGDGDSGGAGKGQGAGRGHLDQGDAGRGRGRGRGRGQITDAQRAEIVLARRPTTIQVTGDGTDDVIVAAAADQQLQHLASFYLRKADFTGFRGQKQIRSFVNSCLINLSNHHTIDTSGCVTGLASTSGRARLSEIMEMPMDIDAGDSNNALSFQFAILPLVGVLTRESVCQSTMTSETGLIYANVYLHRDPFLSRILDCMDQLLDRGSLEDTSVMGARLAMDRSICQVTSLQRALLAITRLIYQLIKRIKDARYEMVDMIRLLQEQRSKCRKASRDTRENDFIQSILDADISRLQRIVADTQGTIIHEGGLFGPSSSSRSIGDHAPNLVHLKMAYNPPGQLSPDGPRHDNDHELVKDIKVHPTQREITCSRLPFLPSNCVPEAPHFLPHGWRRQLDIHFRLLREDMLSSLKKGVVSFLTALEKTDRWNDEDLLRQRGLRKLLDNSVSLNVYGDVQFHGMDCKKKLGGSIEISFTQPAQILGAGQRRRAEFWEKSRRRLMHGALVCIVSRPTSTETEPGYDGPAFQMVLGVITSRDIGALSKDEDAARIQISLTDPKTYLQILNSMALPEDGNREQWFLVETNGGFFEAYRPVLQALQNCEPATLPFGKYIAPTEHEYNTRLDAGGKVDPPLYARAPGFTFDLSVLVKDQELRLDAGDPQSVENAVHMLQRESTLDDTQASALVETLCREVALISGPPGTGKTKIGVDLMRVLLHNKQAMNCGPILCICYTNHALDQFLEHLLDEDITQIVRIGSRSKSERLEQYNLESLMKAHDKPYSVRQALWMAKEECEKLADNITKVENALRCPHLVWEYLSPFLMAKNFDQWEQLASGTPHDDYKSDAASDSDSDRDVYSYEDYYAPDESDPEAEDQDFATPLDNDPLSEKGGYTRVERKKNKQPAHPYVQWAMCADIQSKIRWNQSVIEQEELKQDGANHNYFGLLADGMPTLKPTLLQIPDRDRPLALLTGNVWRMSMRERGRLIESWKPEVQAFMMDELEGLLEKVQKIMSAKNNAFDDIRRTIIRGSSVVGMTTSGAAKMQALIEAVAPNIIICEEAGEVLESHILAALSASTQHLILIGDHLQLRPQIETYTLSSDSTVGQNYNLDKSLFERLVTDKKSPLPLSHLTIQRRMRPEISSLIRNTLYPDLVDEKRVLEYPNVSGMGANLYFMDHAHAEDSKDQYGMQSFANSFEVRMVGALAQYLIKNGYDKPGDIAVLTPYLGQLSKLRDHLRKSFILVIDERDQEQLNQRDQDMEQGETPDKEANEHIGVRNISLQNHLTLRTIDNYQGEEAKIVIISLVRSNVKRDGAMAASSSIGFLKSPNRTNVLLSRAQHGMYLIGNAEHMRQTKDNQSLWPEIIEELEDGERLGDGFPIICRNHPDIKNVADSPEILQTVAPNGGCTAKCGANMPCGHVCPLSCHPDDKDHLLVKCFQPCPRLHADCEHVCPKFCGEKCGSCMEIVADIMLPCGHVLQQARCYQAKDPLKIICKVKVTQNLPNCEHEHEMNCWEDPNKIVCRKSCGAILACGHECTRPCSDCQKASPGWVREEDAPVARIDRTVHGSCQKECGRIQFCGHACTSKCHGKSPCRPCQQKCEIFCAHSRCKQKCNVPCAACCHRCVWECKHQGQCDMPCGAPCDRLPCNKRCDKELKCGHQCPSICGEKCPSEKFCVECKDPSTMGQIVDLIMQQSLAEVDIDDDPILVLACGHALTMTTLDGMMGMSEYYVAETDKKTGDVQYVGKKDLTNDEVPQVSCPNCRKPIIGILRYGRRVKCSQLRLRSHKHEIAQARTMVNAQKAFNMAQVLVGQRKSAFLASLTQAEDCPESPNPILRILGSYDDKNIQLPNSDFRSIAKIYSIPKAHADAWSKLVAPAAGSLQYFGDIIKRACDSPSKLLFDAAVSHLYRIKTAPTYDLSKDLVTRPFLRKDAVTASDIIQVCVIECGLPRDGFSGDGYVNALHERNSVLILVLALAFAAMNKIGASSGWYWFVEDLLKCARVHIEKLKAATLNGRYDRKAAYARIIHMEVIYRETQWLGLRTFPREEEAMRERLNKVDGLVEKFMAEHKAIKDHCPLGIKDECVARAAELEANVVAAVKIARGESPYSPVTKEEKLQLFKAMSRELGGAGHWYRCRNGHTYVIGECGGAMQEAICPECGTPVGGTGHRLLGDNTRDEEFEAMYGTALGH